MADHSVSGFDYKARQHGHINQREPTLTYSKEIDAFIVDWIYCSIDLGYLVTRKAIHEKAIELIQEEKPQFKASESWIDCFLDHHHLSLRALNGEIYYSRRDFQNNLR